MQKSIQKVQTLIEALPYIREFKNRTVVIKYGGAAMIDEKLKSSVVQDIVLMKLVGLNPVVVHGGGKKISQLMKEMGKEAVFIDGIRVTDAKTMEITEMVLTGLINKELVSLINRNGKMAIGLSGKDGQLIRTRKKEVKGSADYGFVGEIEEINTDLISLLEKNEFITVISPVGFGEDGKSYNLNADTVAGHIALALKAEKLIFLSDVEGIMDEKNKLVSSADTKKISSLIDSGVLKGGMIPKINAGLHALEKGVKKVHIIDGRIEHSLLLEVFTSTGIGTEIID